jgi:pyrroloquinoline quinone (PQQ) biosynthesis protein C
MTTQEFFEQLDTRISKFDLLCHPFYKAWAAGELTREDLQEYGKDYYHHVAAFPTYAPGGSGKSGGRGRHGGSLRGNIASSF